MDACHVISKGAGGPDEHWNLMPLCRKHHIEQHTIGLSTFINDHWYVKAYLIHRGWSLTTNSLIYTHSDDKQYIVEINNPRRDKCQTL